MNIQNIQELWAKDSVIDEFNLVSESLKTPNLHSKYYRIFMEEKITLLAYQDDYRILKFKKFEFYTEGGDSTTPSTWSLPPRGRLLKAEVDRYIEVDTDVITLGQRLQTQLEKVKMIESIIDTFKNRGFAIKNAVDMLKFQAGN